MILKAYKIHCPSVPLSARLCQCELLLNSIYLASGTWESTALKVVYHVGNLVMLCGKFNIATRSVVECEASLGLATLSPSISRANFRIENDHPWVMAELS